MRINNYGLKALCFFAFTALCALSAMAESCSGSGDKRYSASGCGYSTEICCHGTWISGEVCSECASGTCWNGSSCASKGATSRTCSSFMGSGATGNQTRTAACQGNGGGWVYGNWSGTCSCKDGYYEKGGKCEACGTKPSTAPYQYTSSTTPTAAQYKANASMCQFAWKCINGGGWQSNPGTGLDYCVCTGGYTWDSSSQTCKKNAATYKVECSTYTSTSSYYYDTAATAISVCNTGPKYTERTGMLGAGYIEGTLSVSDCPGAHGSFSQTACTADGNGSQYRYSYSTTTCFCRSN